MITSHVKSTIVRRENENERYMLYSYLRTLTKETNSAPVSQPIRYVCILVNADVNI